MCSPGQPLKSKHNHVCICIGIGVNKQMLRQIYEEYNNIFCEFTLAAFYIVFKPSVKS